MKKIWLSGMSIVLLSAVSVHASVYECGALKLTTYAQKIAVTGIEGTQGAVLGHKTKYKPSKKHEGATRFDISSICQSSGDVFVILDKNLSEGQARGRLTVQSTCDGDGGAPSFQSYNCVER